MVRMKKQATPPAEQPSAAVELASMLEVVIEAIPELRRRGVTHILLGQLELHIDAPLPEASPRRAVEQEADFLDPAKFRRADNGEGDALE